MGSGHSICAVFLIYVLMNMLDDFDYGLIIIIF